ncbi:hypothetical protein CkaCkLH20_02339 [Colletotrichum karsti]|uniref:Uncharacterized protein n=1 Tax=Colletotrichum karsti TaxID=1095194 RepID=A0A9P6ID10_9PEZI|nr:uncharacterized protein CkaCkLH20_02339 [Colletotrichum karsti]KAF9880385.1 hypothetical protein CkaCkLH20_02339 [Colletotrichum karsti]
MASILLPRVLAGPAFSHTPSKYNLEDGLITACVVGYVMLGVITYFILNNGRLAGLPAWYKDTDRGKTDKILLGLWYAGILCFWPLVLPPYLASRFAFSCCRRFATRDNGYDEERVRPPPPTQRHGLDLGRWHDIPLDDQPTTPAPRPRGEVSWWQLPSYSRELLRQVSPKTVEEGYNTAESDSTGEGSSNGKGRSFSMFLNRSEGGAQHMGRSQTR